MSTKHCSLLLDACNVWKSVGQELDFSSINDFREGVVIDLYIREYSNEIGKERLVPKNINLRMRPLGGAVAEWSKALLSGEKINEKSKRYRIRPRPG